MQSATSPLDSFVSYLTAQIVSTIPPGRVFMAGDEVRGPSKHSWSCVQFTERVLGDRVLVPKHQPFQLLSAPQPQRLRVPTTSHRRKHMAQTYETCL